MFSEKISLGFFVFVIFVCLFLIHDEFTKMKREIAIIKTVLSLKEIMPQELTKEVHK